MTPPPIDLAGLSEGLGPGAVITDPDQLQGYAGDLSAGYLARRRDHMQESLPTAAVRPVTVEEVEEVVAWANRTRTPLVPFGAGSAVCDNIRSPDALVVDLAAMDRVGEVDDKSRIVSLGAGVRGKALREQLRQRGWTLGHEPQSIDISTVGGWLATRACGQLSARYGGIEDLVCGFQAVLGNGARVEMKPNPRRSTGPDIASLMLGSEGALGIITEATLRVAPIPEDRSDVALRFEHMDQGVAACRRLAQSELRPTVVRLYDRDDAAIFLRHHPDEPVTPLLLLSFDGEGAGDRASRAVMLCEAETADPGLVEHWWEHRNDAVEEYQKIMAGRGLLGPFGVVDTMEVSGTWSILRVLYHSMKEALQAEAPLVGCHLSHVYADGACLYFTIASPGEDENSAGGLLDRWWEAGMTACLAAGGSISHHHGIGRRKARWLPEELGGLFPVLTALKKAMDPNGIMNPGVLGL